MYHASFNFPTGYEGDGHTCQDIDECADGSALCDQVCVNEAGGFRCECNPGYKLVSIELLCTQIIDHTENHLIVQNKESS